MYSYFCKDMKKMIRVEFTKKDLLDRARKVAVANFGNSRGVKNADISGYSGIEFEYKNIKYREIDGVLKSVEEWENGKI